MQFTNTNICGLNRAITSMRNPMNSWDKSDTYASFGDRHIGKNDLDLAKRLVQAGNEHYKFLRMIQVWVDVDMPRYWWQEADCYKFGTKNSCSTIHRLFNKQSPITLDMFTYCEEDFGLMCIILAALNGIREAFLKAETQDQKDYLLLRAKRILPEGFLQFRTWNTNYAELRNIWLQRVKNPHRLKEEWVDTFGEWVGSLPYAKDLIMGE